VFNECKQVIALCGKKDASTGNRTRAARVAGEHSTISTIQFILQFFSTTIFQTGWSQNFLLSQTNFSSASNDGCGHRWNCWCEKVFRNFQWLMLYSHLLGFFHGTE